MEISSLVVLRILVLTRSTSRVCMHACMPQILQRSVESHVYFGRSFKDGV
ncbi:hypothetical protein M758_2G178600 [Ceratodon purpureus]|nr:hypothetical protein M758_2G178600 [Ceratodon purpureus]